MHWFPTPLAFSTIYMSCLILRHCRNLCWKMRELLRFWYSHRIVFYLTCCSRRDYSPSLSRSLRHRAYRSYGPAFIERPPILSSPSIFALRYQQSSYFNTARASSLFALWLSMILPGIWFYLLGARCIWKDVRPLKIRYINRYELLVCATSADLLVPPERSIY